MPLSTRHNIADHRAEEAALSPAEYVTLPAMAHRKWLAYASFALNTGSDTNQP